jgi:hypothetical protein
LLAKYPIRRKAVSSHLKLPALDKRYGIGTRHDTE